jgi:hypothetical protein
MTQHRHFGKDFKAKVAIEVIKCEKKRFIRQRKRPFLNDFLQKPYINPLLFGRFLVAGVAFLRCLF